MTSANGNDTEARTQRRCNGGNAKQSAERQGDILGCGRSVLRQRDPSAAQEFLRGHGS